MARTGTEARGLDRDRPQRARRIVHPAEFDEARGISAAPYDALATFGTSLNMAEPFLRLWTVPLISMPVAAFVLLGMSLLRVHGRVEGQALSVTGFEVRWHRLAALAALLAAGR